MRSVRVNVEKPYDVLIGAGLLAEAGLLIKQSAGSFNKVAVITDDVVAGLYGERLMESLAGAWIEAVYYFIPNGEQSKNAEVLKDVYSFLIKEEITRGDLIIAFGGGVVGDLAGFVAASYLRGLPYVQIPTTLIAQTDSSVGGKTAVNLAEGKNLMGLFHQPSLVICDVDFLNQPALIREGIAEVIKYGILADKELFSLIEAGELEARLEEVVERCVTIKADMVGEDEFDRGRRQLLNLGHTLGHGIEKLSDYRVSHGVAVGIGMAMMLDACVRKGILERGIENRLLNLLKQFNLPSRFDGASPRQIALAAVNDKKRTGDSMNIIVCKDIGDCQVQKIAAEELADFIGG